MIKYWKVISTCLIICGCIFFSACSSDENNIKEDLKLEKFGISEKSINEFFSTGLYKGILDDGKPILVLAMISDILPTSSIDIGLFYKLIDGKKIELGMNIMNPPFILGFDGMYENGKLKLDTTIELGSKDFKIDADTAYNVPTEVKNGFTLVRYFEICKCFELEYGSMDMGQIGANPS